MSLITADVIRDIAPEKVRATSKLFYLYCYARFGHNEFIMAKITYPRHKRTIYRYIADLEKRDMIVRKHHGPFHTTYRIK